jgi:hypothetical protein
MYFVTIVNNIDVHWQLSLILVVEFNFIVRHSLFSHNHFPKSSYVQNQVKSIALTPLQMQELGRVDVDDDVILPEFQTASISLEQSC